MAIGEQIALCALMVLTSKGAAGITGAGLVTLTASLQAFGGTFFSAESIAVGIALVVGIDRIMSEGRALTNCIGNGVATMVIAKLAGRARRRALPGGAALGYVRNLRGGETRGRPFVGPDPHGRGTTRLPQLVRRVLQHGGASPCLVVELAGGGRVVGGRPRGVDAHQGRDAPDRVDS